MGCWDRARARRCTGGGLPSSPFRYARWVHSSTLATFPEAPDNPGRPNFTRSGLEPWPILHEPSQTPRGLRADSHTPHDSGLPTASFHLRRRLIPALCPDIARMTKPPSVQSPFAPGPVLPARGRRSASWASVTSPSSLLRAHAPIPPSHLSFSSSPRSRCLCRLLSAPAASRIFSTLLSASLSSDA